MGKNLDDLIKTALRSEPLRPVPRGFHGKMRARLSIVAMIERERRTLRQARAIGTLLCFTIAATILLTWLMKAWVAPMFFGVPGAMGWWDYAMNSMTASTFRLVLVIGLMVVTAVAGVVALVVHPRRHASD